MTFAERLEQSPAPRVLGDVTLRYEPSMLLGETERGVRSLRSTLLWVGGLLTGLGALGLLLARAPDLGIALVLVLCAAGFMGALWSERADVRRRRFLLNFETNSLRLDFTSPIRGRPRTLVVTFDAVKDVQLMAQADGLKCLTVDFVAGDAVLREVLAAFIAPAQAADAERLQRVLHAAFGLGEAPADSAAVDGAEQEPRDEFVR